MKEDVRQCWQSIRPPRSRIAPLTRDWLANLEAHPRVTVHLTHGVVADLPATASVIVDPVERRRLLGVFVEEYKLSPRPR